MSHLQGRFSKTCDFFITSLSALCILLFCSTAAMAQDDLNIHGVISDAMTSSKLSDVTVTVFKDGNQHDAYTTRGNGKYEFYLDCGAHYEFKFHKSGFVERSIVIDSRNIPEEVIGAGIIMPTDMSMYEITEAMESADMSVFDQPIGKAQYDESEEDLIWDFNYTNKVKGEIFSFIRDVEKKQKELDKEQSAAEKEADKREEQFKEFVKNGDKDLSNDDYQSAVNNYRLALEIKPDDQGVKAKLGDAETKLNQRKAAEELENNYSAALDAGDGFMRTEEYENAIAKYEEALELKPDETYPKDQIKEANGILEEQAANLAKQEAFNKLITEGEAFSADEEYENAIAKFEEALEVIPGNDEAERKLGEAREALNRLKEIAAMQEEYDGLIAEGDELFASADYEASIEKYTAAKNLIEENPYPQEQIEKAEKKLAEIAEREEKQAEFDELVTAGDEAMSGANYPDAISNYSAALEIFSDKAEVKSKLEEAKSLQAELAAKEEKKANYETLIAEADELFESEELKEAKSKYQEAKAVFPEETYPLDQIGKIDKQLAALAKEKEAQEAYASAMETGRSAVEDEKYAQAISSFEEALGVMPDDSDALSALEEAKELQEAFLANQEVEEQYQSLLASADESMANEKFDAARTDYQAALELKSEEEYPKKQLELIDKTIAEREREAAEQERLAELEAEYTAFMDAGESAMTEEDFDKAITNFQDALSVKENDAEAEQKLALAQEKLAELEALLDANQKYDKAIADGDAKFADELFDQAIAAFEKALEAKPEETYPREQIELIEETIANREAAAAEAEAEADRERVAALLSEGDKLVDEKEYASGVDKYEEALAILPEREDIKVKIDEATEMLLASQEKEALEEAYAEAIAEADRQFEKEVWNRAKSGYEEALAIKKDETYPADQIQIIEEKIAAQKEADEKQRQLEIQVEFDEFIEEGDKEFNRNKFEDALNAYESALELIPTSDLALEKIEAVNKQLNEIDAAMADQNRYDDLVEEGDELFDEESYEMAKLKYMDAGEIFPEKDYPPNRIAEIDKIIEQRLLEEEQNAQNALDASYRNAISSGDDAMAKLEYKDARDSYTEALEIKPEEKYPQGQLERIELLIKEQEQAEKERKRKEELALEAERRAEKLRENQVVNTNSEEQAEQFMRDAREAQEKEKYERVKKLKERNKEQLNELTELAAATRAENYAAYESFRQSTAEQFSEAAGSKASVQKSTIENKKALLAETEKRAEQSAQLRAEQHQIIEQSETERQTQVEEWEEQHAEKREKARVTKAEQLEEMKSRSEKGSEKRAEVYAEMEKADEVFAVNKKAGEIREKRVETIRENEAYYAEYNRELSERNTENIKSRSEENRQRVEQRAERNINRNKTKVEDSYKQISQKQEFYNSSLNESKRAAEERRNAAQEQLNQVQSHEAKSTDDYFRTELAESYPQGVTEESSTLGNKVIITRIVVKGNKGDEYKKVLDKAGNYYFKNGQSISENTWHRETVASFDKSKD